MCSARRRAAALAGSLAVLLSVSGCSAQEELVLSYDNSSALYGMAAQDETASETVDFFASDLCVTDADVNNEAGNDFTSASSGVFDTTTGEVVYADNVFERLYPASTTKIMTALVALKYGNLSDTVTVSADALNLEEGSSVCYLKEGDQLTLEQCLYGLLIKSGNDAANAIAETVSGSSDAFVALMNQRAAELGMADTHFCNATGLPAEGHVTSAYDIALMSRELIRNHPDIRQYTTIWMDSLRDGASSLVNTNRLIRFYQGATGLKTGSTDSALYCLSGTAERDGMELIAVIMKAPTSTQRFEDATNLLNYGFSTYTLENVVPESALPPVPVSLGTQATVQPVLGENTHLLLEKAKAGSLQQLVTLADSVEAPVAAGSQLGTLTITSGEEVVAELPILAGEEIPRVTFGQMLVQMLRTAFLCG